MILNQIHAVLLMIEFALQTKPDRSALCPSASLPYDLLDQWKPSPMSDVVNNRADHRYELAVDGHTAATYYKIADNVITFVHTEVPPELGGKGIGSKLVKGALDQVRAEGLKVIAQCPFVKALSTSTANTPIS